MRTKTVKLNKEQLAAVVSDAKLKLVVAGPGSGKSLVLTEAVARAMAHDKDSPDRIAVITYTNAAGRNLARRLDESGVPRPGFIGTLHTFCLRLLREHHGLVNLPAHFTVVDEDQQEGLLRTVMEEMGVKAPVAKVMEYVRGKQFSGDRQPKEALAAVEYSMRLLANGLLDFDMILNMGLKLVEVLKPWPYRRLFIDEAQDGSRMDWAIYSAMPAEHKFVVGDPDQAIFGFRGGEPGLLVDLATNNRVPRPSSISHAFLNPEEYCSLQVDEWAVFKLQNNYRCCRSVCVAANRLIAQNKNRVDKETVPTLGAPGGSVAVKSFQVANEELGFLVDQLRGASQPVLDGSAVLCRTNAQVKEVAAFLSGCGVPVATLGERQDPEDWRLVKLALACLANPWNDLAVYQCLKETRGKAFADLGQASARHSMVSLSEHMGWPFGRGDTDVAQALTRMKCSADSRARVAMAVTQLNEWGGEWAMDDLLLAVCRPEPVESPTPGVSVRTIHSAKGLEWDTVYVPWCEEDGKQRTDAELEEERRVYFVAVTRARRELTLSWCAWRRSPWTGKAEERTRSRFLGEIGL